MAKPEGFPKKEFQKKIKFLRGDEWKECWLWHRGHLIGKEVGGSNDKTNLETQTAWVNIVAYEELQTDSEQNKECMRYYEKCKKNNIDVDFKEEYKVIPGYEAEDDTIPSIFEIWIKGEKKATIRNYFPGLIINYKTGAVSVEKEFENTIKIIDDEKQRGD